MVWFTFEARHTNTIMLCHTTIIMLSAGLHQLRVQELRNDQQLHTPLTARKFTPESELLAVSTKKRGIDRRVCSNDNSTL